jgi:uncharacterized protein
VAAEFEIFKDKSGAYRWTLRHDNGHIISVSDEGYLNKDQAVSGIEAFKLNASSAPTVDVTGDPGGRVYA